MWKSVSVKAPSGGVGIGRGNIIWILGFIGLWAIPAAQLHAVIILGTDTATLSAPSNDPGWSSVGTTANGLGCEYLGNGWVLTAAHARLYNTDGTLNESSETATFNGATYNCVVGSSIRLHETGNSNPIDLSLYKVVDQYGQPPPFSSLSISSATPANNETVMGIGYGYDRAASPTYWNYGDPSWVQVPNPPSDFTGYFWSDSRPKRWGLNKVSGDFLINAGWGNNYAIQTIFNQSGENDEFQLSSGDSGGALFYQNPAGVWTLAGVLEAIGTYTNQPSSTAVIGNASYAVDLSYYRDQVVAAVQVFQFTGILNDPNAKIGTGWQNSQLLGNGGFGNSTGACSISVDFNGHQFTFQSGANNITYSGTLFGTGDLIVQGGDPNLYSITLSGASTNTYTGATQVQSGLLVLDKTAGVAALSGSQIAISSGAILRTDAAQQINTSTAMNLQGGVFNLNNQDQTIGTLSGASGGIQLGSGTLAVNQTAAGAFSGQISGTGNFTKSGGAVLILNGSNSYSGVTSINNGALQLANPSALGTTAGGTNVQNGGALDLNGLSIGNEALTIFGAGSGGNGALVNSNTSATAVFNGPVTLGGNAAAGGSGNMTLNGTMNYGTYAFTKTGAGILTFTGPQIWGNNATATVETGTLTYQPAAGAKATVGTNTPSLYINSGAVVNVNAANCDPLTDGATPTQHVQIINNMSGSFNLMAGTVSVAGISGGGSTSVQGGAVLYSSYISQGQLTIGPGSTVVINAINGGPLASSTLSTSSLSTLSSSDLASLNPAAVSSDLLSVSSQSGANASDLAPISISGLSVVPEPSTWILIVVGALCLLFRRMSK